MPRLSQTIRFYKVPPSDKHSLLWLANWHSALWLGRTPQATSEMYAPFHNRRAELG